MCKCLLQYCSGCLYVYIWVKFYVFSTNTKTLDLLKSRSTPSMWVKKLHFPLRKFLGEAWVFKMPYVYFCAFCRCHMPLFSTKVNLKPQPGVSGDLSTHSEAVPRLASINVQLGIIVLSVLTLKTHCRHSQMPMDKNDLKSQFSVI